MDDRDEIKKVLEENAFKYLPESKRWWVKYLYHFSNIDNIVSILKCGNLYSRDYCKENQLMINENASEEVISNTDQEVTKYVRLYFRPKTPTQYINEGFKPISCRQFTGAHIPVPIFLVFRSLNVLAQENVRFSGTSLATKEMYLQSTLEEFKRIDFEKVYHDGAINPDEDKNQIKKHRHAEVVVPHRLSLDYLDYIWCRSDADYTTLVNFLKDEKILDRYKNKIAINNSFELFNMSDRAYVKRVSLSDVDVLMNIENPFEARNTEITFDMKIGNFSKKWKCMIVEKKCGYKLDLSSLTELINKIGEYRITIYFGNELMHYGVWSSEDDLPF
ncbi:uncharacterized protein DUF4433 [Breznakia blatticola]|uniref:Uncharacterized protein DUF4433 n=1 Tax=Breznakia blatticola TaxID=1754012 RepID=A0A4R7ZA17_9FIRM|nr:DarT ssDNA thymidine ADP-ribosyltransferase family protein [Breznakia blatticola]TDW11825.1 uncharacterized protein DUF4433 [Breznakia blatticola]